MLKFGDVSFDLGFERGRMSATGYVAKISMLRLNIGSGMLRLSSCMLSIGRGPKAVQGKGGGCPPLPCSHLGPRPMLSMHELSLPEPMLSLSMLILATCPEHAQECSEHCSARSERSERPERSEHFWTPGNTVRVQHSQNPVFCLQDLFHWHSLANCKTDLKEVQPAVVPHWS